MTKGRLDKQRQDDQRWKRAQAASGLAHGAKVPQRLKTIGELASGSVQDAFSDLLEAVDGWLRAHKDDIIWFSNKAAEISKLIVEKWLEFIKYEVKYARLTAELWTQYGVTQKIDAALKSIGKTLQSFWDGSITGKINAALEWAFQPFKWLWDKLQSLGLVGAGGSAGGAVGVGRGGFGVSEGTEGGGHGAERRGRFGHGGARGAGGATGSGASLGKEGWWTSERQKYAYDRLRAGGLSDAGAKGLISRWVNVEAAGGPGSVNPLSGAVGIGQWLGPRKAGITSSTSFDDQLAHVLKEIDEDAPGGAKGSGKLLKEARTPEEGARAATAYERAEGYNRATHIDNWTAKTLKGIERVEKAIGAAGKASTGQPIIPGQGDPHKPGFDPNSVKFHDYFPQFHSSVSPLGHRQFASNEYHDHRSLHQNVAVNVTGSSTLDRTAYPLGRTKNASLVRNTTATAS